MKGLLRLWLSLPYTWWLLLSVNHGLVVTPADEDEPERVSQDLLPPAHLGLFSKERIEFFPEYSLVNFGGSLSGCQRKQLGWKREEKFWQGTTEVFYYHKCMAVKASGFASFEI